MTEKDIKLKFVGDDFLEVQKLFEDHRLRLYSFELPVFTSDGRKYADVILEIDEGGPPMSNQMFVLEFKKGEVDVGAAEQVERYRVFLQKQLYRDKEIKAYVVGQSFQKFEIEVCKKFGQGCIQYDVKGGNVRFL